MSKVTIALGSFIVGACFSLLVGNRTIIFAQPAFGQLIVSDVGVPVVPPLRNDKISGSMIGNGPIALDGLEINGSTFVNPTFQYGGGAYKLDHAVVKGKVSIKLIGAAANTAAFLNTFGFLGCPAKVTPHVDMDAPVLRSITLSETIQSDLRSPVGQTR